MKLSEPAPVVLEPSMAADVSTPWLSPLDPTFLVLTGFQDCADEALRYLTEVEKLPPSDPLVLGLQGHLENNLRTLNVPLLLAETACPILQMPPRLSPLDVTAPALHPAPEAVCSDPLGGDRWRDAQDPPAFPHEQLQPSPAVFAENSGFSLSLLESLSYCAAQSSDSAVKCLAEELLSLLQAEAEGEDDSDEDCVDNEDCIDRDINCSMESVDQ